MYRFDNVPLSITYPSISQIKEFKPFTLKYYPILQLEDIAENPCLRTPYLRILKGYDTYISKNNIIIPWDSRENIYHMYSQDSKIFEEIILWMIQYSNIELGLEEEEFEKEIWENRIRNEINEKHHAISDIVIETFKKFIRFEGGFEKIKENKLLFNVFAFSPSIPVPRDINNVYYTLREYVNEKLINHPEINFKNIHHSEYFIDPRADLFPAFGTVPLIDFTKKSIISFKYLSLNWFKNYNSEVDIDAAFKLAYIFPDLFHLWLWRYAVQNLPDNLSVNFKLTYMDKQIFKANDFPEIENFSEFSNYSINVITPDGIFNDTLINDLDINISKLLTEKLIITTLANSNKPYRARKIDDICPFHDFKEYNLCCHQHFGYRRCMMKDVIKFPPSRFERNVAFFQKFLRNEYNHLSKHYYWLYLTMKADDIDQCIEQIDMYIGQIYRNIDLKFIYHDKSYEFFFKDAPVDAEPVTIIPWSPFIYSEDWNLKGIIRRINENQYQFENTNSSFIRSMNLLLSYFPQNTPLNVILMKSLEEKPLHLIQKEKRALWSIVKHRHDKNEDETDDQFEIRKMQDKLENNSKRAGVAIFGDNDVKYLE